MAILKTNQIDKALTKKGFEARPKDHNFYYYINDGKKTNIFTKNSHSKNEVNDFLIGKMASQLHLNKEQFKELIQCTLSAEKYKEILREKKLL